MARLLPLLVTVFFLNFASRAVLAPSLISIEQEYQVSHSLGTSIFLLVNLGFAVSMFLSGHVSSILSHRGTILVSALGIGIVLIVTYFSRSFPALCLSMSLLGLATGLYLPSAMSYLTEVVPEARWGRAISIHETAPTLGYITAPVLYLAVCSLFTWRHSFLFLGAACFVAGTAFALFAPPSRLRGSRPSLSLIRQVMADRTMWHLMVTLALATALSIGVYSLLPIYLTGELRFPVRTVNTLLSLSRLINLAAIPATGWLLDRVSTKRFLLTASLVSGALTVALGAATGSFLLIIVFMQPILLASIFPTVVKACAGIGGSKTRNLNYSFLVPLAMLVGAGLLPKAMGIVGDAFSFRYAFLALGFLQLLYFALYTLASRTSQQHRV